jgi:hypothetical protein
MYQPHLINVFVSSKASIGQYTDPDGNFFLAFLAAAITKTIVTNIAMGLIAQMFVAYAVSYAVTYIATGSPPIAFASFTKGGVCHALNDVALSTGDGIY